MIPPWAAAWRTRFQIDRAEIRRLTRGDDVYMIALGERHIDTLNTQPRTYELTDYEWREFQKCRDASGFKTAIVILQVEHRDEMCSPWSPIALADADCVYAESVARRAEHEKATRRSAAMTRANEKKALAQVMMADAMARMEAAKAMGVAADRALVEVEP